MRYLDRKFRDLLQSYDLEALSAHTGAVYGVWADFRLAYLNPAWFRFAEDNGAAPDFPARWGLGRSILDCVSGEVRAFYETEFERCLGSHRLWEHEYECSSDAVYRLYHQIVYPLGQGKGLLIVNSLIAERPHDPDRRPAGTADESLYVDDHGFFCQCAHCRRVKCVRDAERWDWVPEWVKRCPENTSHTFCPTCIGYHYPMLTAKVYGGDG